MREWIRAGPVGREREGGRASGRWGTHLRRLLYRGEGRKRGAAAAAATDAESAPARRLAERSATSTARRSAEALTGVATVRAAEARARTRDAGATRARRALADVIVQAIVGWRSV